MDELIEQMAAKAPPGPPCLTCGRETHLVVFGEQWCSRCRILRPCPQDPRLAETLDVPSGSGDRPAERIGRRTRAA